MDKLLNPTGENEELGTIIINLYSAPARAAFGGLPPGVALGDITHAIRLYRHNPGGSNTFVRQLQTGRNSVEPGTYVIDVSGNIRGWPFSSGASNPFTVVAGRDSTPNITMERLPHSVVLHPLNNTPGPTPPSLNFTNLDYQTITVRSFGSSALPGDLLTVVPPTGFELAISNAGPFNPTPLELTMNQDGTAVFYIRPTVSASTGIVEINAGPTASTTTIAEFAVSFANVINIATVDDLESGPGWVFNDPVLTISGPGANVTITGSVSNGRRIETFNNNTITLNNVSISGLASNESPLDITSGGSSLTLNLEGTKTLSAVGANLAGIQVTTGRTVTINGPGSLVVTGGTDSAGIGGGGSANTGGNITITGGTVTATGGSDSAGIGGGAGSNITITGGTVIANGTGAGAGIGGGSGSNGGVIDIYGGSITATAGNDDAAAIGRGDGGSSENVDVELTVTWDYWTNINNVNPGGPPTGTGTFTYSATYSFIRLEAQ